MGQKIRKAAATTQVQSLKSCRFKVFEYDCPHCKAKRTIQVLHRNEVFLDQTPRVVCGSCDQASVPRPYKALEFECPLCRGVKKVRVPAKPVPLDRYHSSVVSCACGFRGEVSVGRLMDVVCEICLTRQRQMVSTWTENGDSVKAYCGTCRQVQHSIALPRNGAGPEALGGLRFTCGGCCRERPLNPEQVIRSQGQVNCDLCGWVGYPESLEADAEQFKVSRAQFDAELLPDAEEPGRGPPESVSGHIAARPGPTVCVTPDRAPHGRGTPDRAREGRGTPDRAPGRGTPDRGVAPGAAGAPAGARGTPDRRPALGALGGNTSPALPRITPPVDTRTPSPAFGGTVAARDSPAGFGDGIVPAHAEPRAERFPSADAGPRRDAAPAPRRAAPSGPAPPRGPPPIAPGPARDAGLGFGGGIVPAAADTPRDTPPPVMAFVKRSGPAGFGPAEDFVPGAEPLPPGSATALPLPPRPPPGARPPGSRRPAPFANASVVPFANVVPNSE